MALTLNKEDGTGMGEANSLSSTAVDSTAEGAWPK